MLCMGRQADRDVDIPQFGSCTHNVHPSPQALVLIATRLSGNVEVRNRKADDQVNERLRFSNRSLGLLCIAERALMHDCVSDGIDVLGGLDECLPDLTLRGVSEIDGHEQAGDLAVEAVRPPQELVDDRCVEFGLASVDGVAECYFGVVDFGDAVECVGDAFAPIFI